MEQSATIENLDNEKKELTLPEKIQAFSVREKLGAFIFITEHGNPNEVNMTLAGNGSLGDMCRFSKHLDYHVSARMKAEIEGGMKTNTMKQPTRNDFEPRDYKLEESNMPNTKSAL